MTIVIKILLTIWLGIGAYLFIKSLEAMHSPRNDLDNFETGLHDALHDNLPLTYFILFITCVMWPVVLPVSKLLRLVNK